MGRVHDATITGNVFNGPIPLKMEMTGMCVDYVGTVKVTGNTAHGYTFYCGINSSANTTN